MIIADGSAKRIPRHTIVSTLCEWLHADCVDDAQRRVEATAQAARRWRRLTLDTLEERAPFFRRVFLRFGPGFTGAVGIECNVTAGEDSAGVSAAGAAKAIELAASPLPFIAAGECGAEDSSGSTGAEVAIILCASLRSAIRPRPKANLTIAPYHRNMDSAVSSHSAAGVAIGVRSAVPASWGAVPSVACSRNNSVCSDLITDSSDALRSFRMTTSGSLFALESGGQCR